MFASWSSTDTFAGSAVAWLTSVRTDGGADDGAAGAGGAAGTGVAFDRLLDGLDLSAVGVSGRLSAAAVGGLAADCSSEPLPLRPGDDDEGGLLDAAWSADGAGAAAGAGTCCACGCCWPVAAPAAAVDAAFFFLGFFSLGFAVTLAATAAGGCAVCWPLPPATAACFAGCCCDLDFVSFDTISAGVGFLLSHPRLLLGAAGLGCGSLAAADCWTGKAAAAFLGCTGLSPGILRGGTGLSPGIFLGWTTGLSPGTLRTGLSPGTFFPLLPLAAFPLVVDDEVLLPPLLADFCLPPPSDLADRPFDDLPDLGSDDEEDGGCCCLPLDDGWPDDLPPACAPDEVPFRCCCLAVGLLPSLPFFPLLPLVAALSSTTFSFIGGAAALASSSAALLAFSSASSFFFRSASSASLLARSLAASSSLARSALSCLSLSFFLRFFFPFFEISLFVACCFFSSASSSSSSASSAARASSSCLAMDFDPPDPDPPFFFFRFLRSATPRGDTPAPESASLSWSARPECEL
mmetsp:Transcript_5865/g.13208  ORF Transcript_5865/g.13208 Transcript_5865/m.13208 type:complete len:519 (-) Transcript_5865:2179-3735(-)